MACHSEIAAGIDYAAFAVSFSLTLSLLCYANLSFGQSLIPVSQCCVASFTFGALQLQLTPLLGSYNWFTSQSWKCYCLFVVLLLHRLELIYSGNLLCFLFEIHGFLQISKLQPNVVTSRTCLQPHKLCVVAVLSLKPQDGTLCQSVPHIATNQQNLRGWFESNSSIRSYPFRNCSQRLTKATTPTNTYSGHGVMDCNHLYIWPSTVSICLSIHPSIHPSIHLIYLSMYVSVYLSVCLFVYLPFMHLIPPTHPSMHEIHNSIFSIPSTI